MRGAVHRKGGPSGRALLTVNYRLGFRRIGAPLQSVSLRADRRTNELRVDVEPGMNVGPDPVPSRHVTEDLFQ